MRLEWDQVGEKKYEMGTDRGVLYPMDNKGEYSQGYVWNGLSAVTETPGGAEPTNIYADNIKYASMRSAETFGCTIEAYTYPSEFAACDGSKPIAKGVTVGQQTRNTFGFSYRTLIGNDTATEEDDGYKLHLVYGCTASPSEKGYQTVSDSPEAITMSWEIETTPVNVPGLKPSATIVIDSTECDPAKLKKLEDILYGTDPDPATVATYGISTHSEDGESGSDIGEGEDEIDVTEPSNPSTTPSTGTISRLPLPAEIMQIFAED